MPAKPTPATVLTPRLGGAALNVYPQGLCIAPIRLEDPVRQQAEPLQYPTDPWPEARMNYGPAGDLLFPEKRDLVNLLAYLVALPSY